MLMNTGKAGSEPACRVHRRLWREKGSKVATGDELQHLEVSVTHIKSAPLCKSSTIM